MASVNKVILVGNAGADAEVRYTPDGAAICTVRLATSESWKDKNTGEKKEMTEWHRVVFYRKLGEIAGQYVKKGTSIYVEGRLQTRKWTDKDGVERYTTEVVCDVMQLLGGRGAGQTSDHRDDDPPAQPRSQNSGGAAPASRPTGGGANGDDDIPFGPYCARAAWASI